MEGALPEAGESAEGEAGAVWAGGEEPAQQLCVSRASIPSGSAALTHPAAPSLPRGDPWGPGAALAHGGHCEPPQPHTGTPRVPRVKSPPMLCVLTGEMPVAFPARPQRGSEVPWGRAGPAVPPHRAPEQGWAGREEEAGGGRGRAALTRAGSGFGSGCPPLRQMPPPSLCWWLSPLLCRGSSRLAAVPVGLAGHCQCHRSIFSLFSPSPCREVTRTGARARTEM